MTAEPGHGSLTRTLLLPPDLNETASVRRLVQEMAPALGFDRDRVFDISVAVSEATANAIEHASPTGEVRVQTRVFFDRLEIDITGPGQFRVPAGQEGRQHR